MLPVNPDFNQPQINDFFAFMPLHSYLFAFLQKKSSIFYLNNNGISNGMKHAQYQ